MQSPQIYQNQTKFKNINFGNSELTTHILNHNWAETPLGEINTWPENLCIALSLCLTSRFPMAIWWGSDLNIFYNDAYISFLGHKHPSALGQPATKIWAEVWHDIKPQVNNVLENKKACWFEDMAHFINRNLQKEEIYVTYSLSPILGKNKVDGLCAILVETTAQTISNQRLETLRQLGLRTTELITVDEACKKSAAVLANNTYDIPFVAIYLVDDIHSHAVLKATSGIVDQDLFPETIHFTQDKMLLWPLQSVLETQKNVEINLVELNLHFPGGPWPEPCPKAFVLPIPTNSSNPPAGCLIVGVSPRRVLDTKYQAFFNMVASHIGNIIVDAKAYEHECNRAEELAKIDRAKTHFFNNVSHEFRTPLTLILSPLEEILTHFSSLDKSAIHLHLQTIHRNAIRLLKLINNLLSFSRIEAQRTAPNLKLTDFSLFIKELASVFRSTIERAGLKFIVECAPLPTPIYIDREMWEKIIFNLLSNAFKFTFKGEIKLSLAVIEDHIHITVKDTGIGIDAHELPKIFDRFHRVEESRGRTHEGSGIGLTLVKELVHMHGGNIQVKSTLGKETEFTILLLIASLTKENQQNDVSPLSSKSIHGTAFINEAESWLPSDEKSHADSVDLITSSHDNPSTTARILIVDDNLDMREYLTRLLSQKWIVETAIDGKEALILLSQKKFNLILTDVMMPGLDGFGLLKNIRDDDSLKNVPVIMLSARAATESRIEALDAGADDYLTKPFTALEVIARVDAQLKLAMRYHLTSENEILRKEIEEAEKASREKDIFLATLSHELRTPITAILCWVQSLKNKRYDEKTLDKVIHSIEESANVQARLLNDLLDISSIILGKISIRLNNVDLISLIKASMNFVESEAKEKNIKITLKAHASQLKLFLDSDRIIQVFYNLLNNAIKFTANNGKIDIAIDEMEHHMQVTVSDNGQGITTDFLPRIFDRFTQAPQSARTEFQEGLGLGLPLVRYLLELQGATIKAESSGLNQGSIFTILFSKINMNVLNNQVDLINR